MTLATASTTNRPGTKARPSSPTATEAALRERLGVPAGAERVVVVTESTHWDPNWLFTSNEYFRLMVGPTLDRALDALDAEPRRVYSLECAFYPDMYWNARPERRDAFRRLVEEGRLRFTGSGVTTPDTLLPEDELLLRDLHLGGKWLRDRNMTQQPRVLYLPDSFGHSPGLPGLLGAAGVPYAAICRIDGMRFPGAELESATHFPVPGTSAATLSEAGSADFLWQGADGSEVLTHWHAFGYGHGDMIANGGLTRVMGLPLAWPSRGERKVAARIERWVAQLTTLARTPYLLLAIGFDFSRPIPRLVELLDVWNAHGYERTGIWLVNAGLDDYLDLVGEHRDELPSLALDPNPYWTGFYSTRPRMKRACRDLGRDLIAADHARAARLVAGGSNRAADTAGGHNARGNPSPWWIAATSNHHDFVTGTSPDRVAKAEQWPWLVAASTEARRSVPANSHNPTSPSDSTSTESAKEADKRVSWHREGTRVTVTTPLLTATFDEAKGGSLTALTDIDGKDLVRPGTLALTAYVERGGLWRMGYEFPGGLWRSSDSTASHRASVTVTRTRAGVRVNIVARLEDRPASLTVDIDAQSADLVVRTNVTPPLRRTVTLGVSSSGPISGLAMHQPGGVVTRPLQRRYSPTFWPLHSWAAATKENDDDSTVVVSTPVPTGIHANPQGSVEVIVARNAPRELAWRVVPLLGPATGHESGTHRGEVAIGWSASANAAFVAVGRRLWERADRAAGRKPVEWIVAADDDLVEVSAVKEADLGEGIIIRLRSWAAPGDRREVPVALTSASGASIDAAWRCDSNERDLEPLVVTNDQVVVPIDRYLTSVRLATSPIST